MASTRSAQSSAVSTGTVCLAAVAAWIGRRHVFSLFLAMQALYRAGERSHARCAPPKGMKKPLGLGEFCAKIGAKVLILQDKGSDEVAYTGYMP